MNSTCVPAELTVAGLAGGPNRIGVLATKATYRYSLDGAVELEDQQPVPIFPGDEETELGLLPRDDLPRRGDEFEVILLGQAHAPEGRPVSRMEVSLSVGEIRRTITVSGNREWEGNGRKSRIGKPAEFLVMPLTWDRAFGGSYEVLIDVESPVDLFDVRNPEGKGFNVEPHAGHMGKLMKAPKGFPTYDPRRPLPNIENPRQEVRNWDDEPEPYCWATLPMSCYLHMMRSFDLPDEPKPDDPIEATDGLFYRAHPDWVIETPSAGPEVQMTGLHAGSREVRFRLPGLRVLADYTIGEREGTMELRPHSLVLLTEERRFYLVFKALFNFPLEPEVERCFRLRLEDGWITHSER